MRVFLTPAMRALGLTLSLPVVAAAQAQTCDVDEGRPNQVARAKLAFEMALGAQDPATAGKQLSSAVRYLTDKGDQMANQVGRHFVLGKALVLWASQPNVSLVATRGQLGYATDPQGQVDLVAAIDSSFKIVEAANPECIGEIARFRSAKPWVDLINMAIERMNADANDSARVLAMRATQLNPFAPYGYVVLGNVSQKSGQGTEAFKLYTQAIEAAKRDTSYNDARRQAQLYLGLLAADSAESVSDAAARTRYAAMARSVFQALLSDAEAGEFGRNARDGMCRVSIAIGDTASLRQTYAPVLATPAQFTFDDLMSAGICLARADMLKEASIALRGAYDKNAYHRDAVSNLAIMHLRQDQFEQALPLAQRLSMIEPNNPEGIELLMLSYAGIAKRAADARKAGTPATGTKAGARPTPPRLSAAAADSLFRIEKAYTDSAFRANAMKTGLTSQVQLSGFNSKDGEATLRGSVNLTGVVECQTGTFDPEEKKCRLADGKLVEGKPADGNYVLTVEFLDAAGKVIATQDSEPLTVRANSAARFTVTGKGAGITSFRYRLRRA